MMLLIAMAITVAYVASMATSLDAFEPQATPWPAVMPRENPSE